MLSIILVDASKINGGTQYYSHIQPRAVVEGVQKREMVSWPAPGGGSGVWPDMSDVGTDEPGMGYGRKSLARVTWESGPRDQES